MERRLNLPAMGKVKVKYTPEQCLVIDNYQKLSKKQRLEIEYAIAKHTNDFWIEGEEV